MSNKLAHIPLRFYRTLVQISLGRPGMAGWSWGLEWWGGVGGGSDGINLRMCGVISESQQEHG